jgi:hypothetical protein
MQKLNRDDESMNIDAGAVRKAPANARPIEGHVLLVDGKFKSQFQTAEDAMAAGIKLKEKYPVVRVQIYDAVKRSYAPVESGDRSSKLPGD